MGYLKITVCAPTRETSLFIWVPPHLVSKNFKIAVETEGNISKSQWKPKVTSRNHNGNPGGILKITVGAPTRETSLFIWVPPHLVSKNFKITVETEGNISKSQWKPRVTSRNDNGNLGGILKITSQITTRRNQALNSWQNQFSQNRTRGGSERSNTRNVVIHMGSPIFGLQKLQRKPRGGG